MNHFNQNQIDLMLTHINPYRRASISSTPYELMKVFYGEDFLKKIRIEYVNHNNIILTPVLLK